MTVEDLLLILCTLPPTYDILLAKEEGMEKGLYLFKIEIKHKDNLVIIK